MSGAGRGEHPVLVLDGHSLTIDDLTRVARDPAARVELAAEARERIRAGRRRIDAIAARYREDFAAYHAGTRDEPPVQDYGVTTGFGEFKNIPVPPDQLEEAQRNLLLSHAVGIGDSSYVDDAASYFPPDVVRATLVLRANTFALGHSGVSEALVDTVLAMLHAGVVPLVPTKGSMGSSGDLCPLSHCFGVLLGEGRYVRVRAGDDLELRPWQAVSASDLAADLADHLPASLDGPAVPGIKEGLGLSNGATVSTAVLALATHDATVLAHTADAAAALSLEAACGCARAFDPQVHAARGHQGQIASAAALRQLLDGSRQLDSSGDVQDAYSLRCAPVVHGASRDAIDHVRRVVETECNAATDNPLFFDQAPWDHGFADNWPDGYDGTQRASFSAGNFHGQPIALAADILAVAVAELANVSERRSQLLLDRHHNRNLPANLVARRGTQSGCMLLQYAAASLVTENKVLCHPASVDSIPTAANIEDHVAVATTAARKLRTVIGNVEAGLAVELLVAAQGVDWRVGFGLPARPGPDGPRPLRGESNWQEVEDEARRFAAACAPGRRDEIAAALGRGTSLAYRRVREVAEPVTVDRPLDGDIRAVRRQVAAGAFVLT